MKTVRLLCGAALLLTAGAAFAAGPEKGRISLRIMGGADFPIGGALHEGANVPIANLGVLNPALTGVSATLGVEERGWRRFLNGDLAGNVELGYGLSNDSEVFGAFRYQELGSGSNVVGAAQVPALNASLPITANFRGGGVYTGEIGYRRYFGTTFRPYLAGRIGVSFTDRISADIAVPAANIALRGTPFYRNSVSATGGIDAGIAIPLGARVDLNLETGIRYTTGLRGDDSALGGLGLAGLNNAGDRWDIPARAGLTFRF